MFLKRRYGFGYETLVQEVSDSITWRRFCGISLTESVPDATTLIKSRKRYGEKIVDELNELLLKKTSRRKNPKNSQKEDRYNRYGSRYPSPNGCHLDARWSQNHYRRVSADSQNRLAYLSNR
jgi:hypothetical protein